MPTEEQIEAVREQIEELTTEHFRGFTEWKDDRLLCEWVKETEWEDGKEGTSLRSWGDLDGHAIDEILRAYVKWEGFEERQKLQVIGEIAAGIDTAEWIQGVTNDLPREVVVEDFSIGDIHKLMRTVSFLQGTTYDIEAGRAVPLTGLECMDPYGEPKFDQLDQAQRAEVLNRYIDWVGFAPTQADKLIENIASGRDRGEWFEGVPPGWRGVGEQNVQEWLAFDGLPEDEQLRVAARMMQQSMTLSGDAVMVHAKWDEMSERQQRDVVIYQLMRDAPDLSYWQKESIIKEELGWQSERTGKVTDERREIADELIPSLAEAREIFAEMANDYALRSMPESVQPELPSTLEPVLEAVGNPKLPDSIRAMEDEYHRGLSESARPPKSGYEQQLEDAARNGKYVTRGEEIER